MAAITTLDNVVKGLGPEVVRVIAAPAGLDVAVSRAVLFDPSEHLPTRRGDIVLGLGVLADSDRRAVLARLARARAAALVVKSSAHEDRFVDEANQVGLNLLTIPAAADWAQVLLLLSSAISNWHFETSDDRFTADDAGELFAVANLVADQLRAPITIEDSHSRLLAFSSRQEGADPPRIAAILGRSIPQLYMDMLKQRGVLRRLSRERGPIFIEELGPNTKPRAVISIRAGDEVIGSMWALLDDKLTEDQERDMIHAADFVALHVLRHRMLGDLQTRLDSDMVAAALQGGPHSHEAIQRLHLHGARFRAIACSIQSSGQDVEPVIERTRDLLQFQLSFLSHGSKSAVIDETIYAVVPVGLNALATLKATLDRFASRAAATIGVRVRVGIGAEVPNASQLADSRFSAEQVLKVLSRKPEVSDVACIEDVRWRVLMMRFAESCRDDLSLAAGPIDAIRDYDSKRHTAYYPTLCAFLDAFGNIHTAAKRLGVHPNTVRYRLRQIAELSNINLEDPAERLGLMLELAISPTEPSQGQPTERLGDEIVS